VSWLGGARHRDNAHGEPPALVPVNKAIEGDQQRYTRSRLTLLVR
jgi:hypothetical protein